MEISVVIPTRNRLENLKEALAGVPSDIEVVVVDDGSNISVLSQLEVLRDICPRVVVLSSSLGLGAAAARNLGVRQTSSGWVCFLDDDDLLCPNYIDAMKKLVSAAPDVLAWIPNVVGGQVRRCKKVTENDLLFRNIAGGCSGLFIRKDFFNEFGGFDERFPSMQDWDLWIRLIKRDALHYSGLSGVRYSKSSVHKITHDLSAKYYGLRRLFFKHRDFWTTESRRAHLIRLWALRQLLNGKKCPWYLCLKRVFAWPTAFGYYLKWRRFVN